MSESDWTPRDDGIEVSEEHFLKRMEAMYMEESPKKPLWSEDSPKPSLHIRSVWKDNIEEEFKLIGECTKRYKILSMDTEFPGVVHGDKKSRHPEIVYEKIRLNVNDMKLIQFGITLSNEHGNLPNLGHTDRCYAWEINFNFDYQKDLSSPDSIQFLRDNAKLDFEKLRQSGIDASTFGYLITSSGLIMNEGITYIAYKGMYDFAYLLRAVSGRDLPETIPEFYDLLKVFLTGPIYDLRYLQITCPIMCPRIAKFEGGLKGLARGIIQGLSMTGRCHNAGYDSALTQRTFFKICERFCGNMELEKKSGVINQLFCPPKLKLASHIVGYPRIGPWRELNFALQLFWDGKISADDLEGVSAHLRFSTWKQISDAETKYIPSNTFSYYDHMLDTTAMLGAVPSRYKWRGGELDLSTYFSMARGNASAPAMEMAKWFDTNYHFIVPELGPDVKFCYASHKAVNEYKEAREYGFDTVPVLVGPVTYLLLSKPAKGVEKTFAPLSLLDKILPIYRKVIFELKAAGASWIQFDEPTLVLDLESHELEAYTKAYAYLASAFRHLNILIATYFADIPVAAYKTLTSLSGVTAFGFDLVHGTKTLDLIRGGFPSGKYLFAGVVDGRNVWANHLTESLSILKSLERIVGKDKLIVSTSSSLLHIPVDLENETNLDPEIVSWLSFAAQKILEVNILAKALQGGKDEAFFSANAATLCSRRFSPRVINKAVQESTAALKESDHYRSTSVIKRLDAQQKKLKLPNHPITAIGSFPHTIELKKVRREYKAKKISEEEYIKYIKKEIDMAIKIQENIEIDVLGHGEPERSDIVDYFGGQLSGFALTGNGWVQSYGSQCVKPPIIYGDVSRPRPITVFWSKYAQTMTKHLMKGILTGPVTILNRSFARNDQFRSETCYQIALAIKDEVEDLEKAGIEIIQIDEAGLMEGLPLRKSEQDIYLDWAAHSFRITNDGVQDTTKILTLCSNFDSESEDIVQYMMDADVNLIKRNSQYPFSVVSCD